MSLTIDVNKLKFTIFASGHDYTLADSGDGEVQVFSHPFVPLNSVMYAGQWFFLVPDEQGDPMDCVKDDLAHCTFTPALGSAFSTEGEVTVECHYHREYIYPEETLVVDKTVTQKITVVNHGAVSSDSNTTRSTLYSDGYLFYRPNTYSSVENNVTYYGLNKPTKVSSFPWRAVGLGGGSGYFCDAQYLADISELQFGDTSNVKVLKGLFYNSPDIDLTPIKEWDVSNVEKMEVTFQLSKISDYSPLSSWNFENLTEVISVFNNAKAETLHGVENWDVSKVVTMTGVFQGMINLLSLEPLLSWDTSSVEDLSYCFDNLKLSSLHGLENWNVSKVTGMTQTLAHLENVTSLLPLSNWKPKPSAMYRTFYDDSNLLSVKGLEGFDVSECASLIETFAGGQYIATLEGLETWDTANVTSFEGCFRGAIWLGDIEAIGGWSFESAISTRSMFAQVAKLLDLNVDFDLSNVTDMNGMFGCNALYYATSLGEDVWADYTWFYDYEGNRYSQVGFPPTVLYSKDASDAQNWIVSGTGLNAFNNVWDNIPSWN